MESDSKFFHFCEMIDRIAYQKLKELAGYFKAIAVVGPRQSGKTTLVKNVFKDKEYVSLENPDHRNFALEDPRGFLSQYPKGVILDEVQRTPNLFSYLQQILDDSREKGLFILTGSNNFLLQESISQTLAGRVGYLNLPPFSYVEIQDQLQDKSDNEIMFSGFYPPIYDQHIPAEIWTKNYIKTYVERDVRQIKNINDLIVFERFLALLAGRCGQELNMSSLSIEVGLDVKTIQSWLGILESSFIIHMLPSHHKNFNKIIVKRPKLYFLDTAIICSLLGVNSAEVLQNHPLRGHIFENLIVTELIKLKMHQGEKINLFYWRDKTGHEIDLIEDIAGKLFPIEIKAGQTIQNSFFKNLNFWMKLSGENSAQLLYSGDQHQKRSNGIEVMNWRQKISE